MDKPIYLDYNATTPIDRRVLDALLPFLGEEFGNPSSAHPYGRRAHAAVEVARSQVAGLVGARADEIIFTGGGSETDNLAIKGALFANLADLPHVVATTIEHPAVLNTLAYLRHRFGIESTLASPDASGIVSPEAIRKAARSETRLITVMHANNETGTIQPIAEIAQVARDVGAFLHVDAAQSAGKVPIDVIRMGIDLLTIAGHKLYAPKGIGALYARRGVALDPLIHGSSQEGGRRAGTENVHGMVALGTACAIAQNDLGEAERVAALRDRLEGQLARAVPGLAINGDRVHRLPNTSNISFPGVPGAAVLAYAPEVAASTGSACHSGDASPSPVLTAMGLSADRALGAVRLSLGRMTTELEVDQAAAALVAAYYSAAGIPASAE